MSSKDDQTHVDLGTDLLESPTRVIETHSERKEVEQPIEDLLKNAKILFDENLVEQSKKVLWSVLRRESENKRAKKLLDEIHEKELQQIFSETDVSTQSQPSREFIDTDKILFDLDRDLSLKELTGEDSFFKNVTEQEHFLKNLDIEIKGKTSRERIDLSIAFIEMELTEVAIHLLSKIKEPALDRLIASSLLANCYLMSRQEMKALLLLEQAVRDDEILTNDKTDLFYLLGRVHERLNNNTQALSWYLKAKHIDSYYRDIRDRIRILESKTKKR